MKKFLSLILVLIMSFSLVSCGIDLDFLKKLGRDDDEEEKFTAQDAHELAKEIGYISLSSPKSEENISGMQEMLSEALNQKNSSQNEEEKLSGGILFAGSYADVCGNQLIIIEHEDEKDQELILSLLEYIYGPETFMSDNGNVIVIGHLEEDVSSVAQDDIKTVSDVKGKNPQQLYKDAYADLASEQNISMCKKQIAFDATGKMLFHYSTTIAIDGNDQYKQRVSLSENKYEYEFWYIDGIYYLDSDGSKLKGNLDNETFLNYFGVTNASEEIINVPDEWYNGIKIKKVGEKNFMTFNVSSKEYTTIAQNAFSDIFTEEGISISLSNIKYRVFFDIDGNFNYAITDYQMTLTKDGEKEVLDLVEVSFVNERKTISVFEPSNSADFENVDWQKVIEANK